MNKIVIVGASGLAKEIYFLIKEIIRNEEGKWEFLGFIDNELSTGTHIIDNFNVIGNDDWVLSTIDQLNVVFGIGFPKLIKKLSMLYTKNEHLKFPNLIHPNATGDWENVNFGRGNIICAGVSMTTHIVFGSFNLINLNSTIGHDTIIGNCNVFNPSVNVSGNVKIKNCTLLGTGCQVLQNIEFNTDHVIVGSSACVVKNIKSEGTYIGIPARKFNINKI